MHLLASTDLLSHLLANRVNCPLSSYEQTLMSTGNPRVLKLNLQSENVWITARAPD
jgi:hypothetical protein